MRFACINYLEAIVDKVPDAMRYLSTATGPSAPFEKPRSKAYLSPSRKRPFARLGSTFTQGARELFAKWNNGRDEKSASGLSWVGGTHSAGEASPAPDSNSAALYPAVKGALQRGVATSDRDELTSTG